MSTAIGLSAAKRRDTHTSGKKSWLACGESGLSWGRVLSVGQKPVDGRTLGFVPAEEGHSPGGTILNDLHTLLAVSIELRALHVEISRVKLQRRTLRLPRFRQSVLGSMIRSWRADW